MRKRAVLAVVSLAWWSWASISSAQSITECIDDDGDPNTPGGYYSCNPVPLPDGNTVPTAPGAFCGRTSLPVPFPLEIAGCISDTTVGVCIDYYDHDQTETVIEEDAGHVCVTDQGPSLGTGRHQIDVAACFACGCAENANPAVSCDVETGLPCGSGPGTATCP
jgi:hypothetical protein